MRTEWAPYVGPRTPNTVVGDLRVRDVVAPALGRPVEVLCLMPPAAATQGRRYPVIYMFDGQNLFDAAPSYAGEWQVDETMLALRAEGLDAIVVGLANGAQARFAEYTPYPSRGWHTPRGGDGPRTLDLLVDTIKPLIDASFPTLPDPVSTVIAGSSLGGLMSLFVGWARPDIFGRVAAFSPAFPPGQAQLCERIAREPRPTSRVYLDTGGREGRDMRLDRLVPYWSWTFRRDVRRCRDALAAAGFTLGRDLRYVEDPPATHSEAAWAARLPDALRFLLAPTRTADLND